MYEVISAGEVRLHAAQRKVIAVHNAFANEPKTIHRINQPRRVVARFGPGTV